jgi:hypothetical protein
VPASANYEIFQFIRARLEKWRQNRSIPLADAFKREIIRLPKSLGRGKRKRESHLRRRLAKDWYFLKHSITEGQALKHGKVPKHYFITQRFLAESLNPTAPTDRILADKEAIAM